MKRFATFLTAAVFAGAMSLPGAAFAQAGAGASGGASGAAGLEEQSRGVELVHGRGFGLVPGEAVA